MLKRRRVGLAYERAPAEKVAEWIRRNTLVFTAGVIAIVGWWIVVIFGCWVMNWIAGSGEMSAKFDDSSPVGVAVKLIGGFVVFVLIVKSQAK